MTCEAKYRVSCISEAGFFPMEIAASPESLIFSLISGEEDSRLTYFEKVKSLEIVT